MERTNLILSRSSRDNCQSSMHLSMASDTQGNHVADGVPAPVSAWGESVNVGIHPAIAANLARPRCQQEFRPTSSQCSARPRLMLSAVVVSAQAFGRVGALAPINATGSGGVTSPPLDLAGPAAFSVVLSRVSLGGLAAIDAERLYGFTTLVVAGPASHSRVGDSFAAIDAGSPSLRLGRLARSTHLCVLGHLAAAYGAGGRKRVRARARHTRLGDDGLLFAATGTGFPLPPHSSHPNA